MMTALDDAI